MLQLEDLPEALFLTDSAYRVLDCNSRAAELLRAPSREALLGRSLATIPAEHDLNAGEFPTNLPDRLKAVPFLTLENRLTRDDGTRFFAETTLHRLAEDRLLFSIRDVTVRTESLHRLAEANERLRATIRDRMEFVSNVSHELRTPLTSMSYALANLRRGLCGPLPEKVQAYLERLQVDVKRLMTTVNDILDLRQMENGTLTLRKRCTPLQRLLADSANALLIQAETKHQTLTVEPRQAELYALVDSDKFERVCFNILSNAVKYTPERGTIRARLAEEPGFALIQVDDTGIGIPPEALPRVSQRYFRVGAQVAGTGLGLSIVREIAELHGGSLTVESPVPGQACGTRVTVRVPTCQPPLAVILSGDDAFIAPLEAQLHALGYSTFANRQAIDLARECAQRTPDRFLLDGSLPPSCLSDWICQIRSAPALANIPILLLAPALDPARRAEYARLQVHCLPWPVPSPLLAKAL